MKLSYLMLLPALLCISKANAQCTWYTKISSADFNKHSLAIKNDSTLWSWGDNSTGLLGDGTTTRRANPIQIGNAKWISAAAGQYHNLAVKSDGTLWVWGSNSAGQLGNGSTGAGQITPFQIGADNNWVSVAAGSEHSIGLKSDGTIWAWGDNEYGQVGVGSSDFWKTTPTQIGIATDWVSIAAGYGHNLGIKSDGTLWAWGYNADGQLGDGTILNKLSPVQIGTATDWASVDAGLIHNFGIKTDGTLWAWGWNHYGQLGDGTNSDRRSPVQIGTGDWVSVAAGDYYSLGIKGDGSLWAWGWNDVGQLGDGSTTNRATPTQIGAANNWALVAAGYKFSFGIKTDGFAYAWGQNDAGQLGDGTVINKISPTPTGTTPNFSLPAVNSSITKTQTSFTIYNSNCTLIASVLKKGGNTAISGLTTAKVWIETTQPAAAYGKRHYEITPAANAGTATGRVTLYFTQQEFTDFNAVNDIKLPVDATDAANNKANLQIEKISGTSSDGTGLPVTYSGPSTTIDPTDANIVWNPTNGYWEVTISTTGFGGFFVKTQRENLVNPLNKAGLTRATPAAVAWSLRLLSTDYTGAAIRVRRDNDNNTQDIGFTPDGSLDVTALNSFVGVNNGYVVRWYDQSGNGVDAKQDDLSRQPIIVRSGVVEKLNGHPAVYFGATNMATAKLVIFTKAASMVGVAKGNSTTPSTFVSKTGTAAGNNNNYPAPFDYTNPGGEFTVGSAATTTYNTIQAASSPLKSIISSDVYSSVYSFVIPSSGTYRNYVNGAEAGSQTVNTFQDDGNPVMLGNRNDGTGSGNFWTPEIVLFNLALSTTERQTLEAVQKALPLQWLSVKGQLTTDNTARITWQVDEHQVNRYEIEKSADGKSYTIIGQVASTGDGKHSYSFTEPRALSGTGYYRIKQTDLDGRFTYSTVIILNNQAISPVTVYPNPAKDVVTVTVGANLLNSVATLYNANGTSMQSFTINTTSFTINLEHYPAGIYFLKTADGNAVRIIRK